MEGVLAVYARPYDEKRPVVCMDEKPSQLLDHERESLPAKPGHTEKSIPNTGGTGPAVCSWSPSPWPDGGMCARYRRTNQDWAHCIKWLLDTRYPEAEKVVLGKDNLIPMPFLPPAEAFRRAQKLEPHVTPKQGSWLAIAEVELSA